MPRLEVGPLRTDLLYYMYLPLDVFNLNPLVSWLNCAFRSISVSPVKALLQELFTRVWDQWISLAYPLEPHDVDMALLDIMPALLY